MLERHRWITFVLPLGVYLLAGTIEPTSTQEGGKLLGLAIPYSAYPWMYLVKTVLTLAAIGLVLPGYRQFPLKLSPWAIVAGVVGIFVWVGLVELGVYLKLSERLLEPIGMATSGERPGYNPFTALADQPNWIYPFIAVRLFGLAVLVPLAEEFFLRGFVMRFVMSKDWWDVPFGKVDATAWAVCIGYAVLTHPAELIAAAVWFGMVTWLMVKTRNIWDCVVAHAVTNLLLGIYVLRWEQWALW